MWRPTPDLAMKMYVLPLLCVCTLMAPLLSRAQEIDISPEFLKPILPHHAADGFFQNPHIGRRLASGADEWKMLGRWWKARKDFSSWQEQDPGLVPREKVNLHSIHNPDANILQFTWIGHSTVLVQYRGINLLTDPIFSMRCSPVPFLGPKRVTKPALDLENLPAIDYVLISHNHYDHLDRATVQYLGDQPHQPQWLVPLGIGDWLKKEGISEQQIREFDWWDSLHENEVHITATPSQHWSGRALNDRYETLWASWHVRIDNSSLWFAGDTGYNPYQFKEIGERLPPADLAIIPIGAYLPREFMYKSHVDPEEAVQIFMDVGGHYAIGVHWGTFQLSAEGIAAPARDLLIARKKLDREESFAVPVLGATRKLQNIKVPH